MAISKKNKINTVKELKEKIKDLKSLVVFEYRGLSVKAFQELKKIAKIQNIEIKVYKNRLFKVAIKGTNFEDLNSSLINQNAFIFGFGDEIAPAKIIFEFAKKYKFIKLKSGIYENKVIDELGVIELAKLTSLEDAIQMMAVQFIYPLKLLSISLNELASSEKHLN